MKGKLIKITRTFEYCDKDNFKETKTEQKVKWVYPDIELWKSVSEDLRKVYSDIDHYEIVLESTLDEKLRELGNIVSWAGFAYLDYNSVEDNDNRIENWYLLVE